MVENKSIGSKLFTVVNLTILFIITLSCVLPLWYTLSLSLSDKSAAAGGMVGLWPVGFNLSSYQAIIKDASFFRAFWVSIMRVVLGTTTGLGSIILMAYPLSKTTEEFRARNVFMWILIFCFMFNGGLIPWFITIQKLGLIDSIWALVFSGGVQIFNVILVMNFIRNIPASIEEAAIVDGAGPWRILVSIVVPMSKPVIATVTLFTMVYHWNEFFQGLVLMSSERMYPLQTYIRQLVVTLNVTNMSLEQYERVSQLSNQTLNAAKIFISLIPVLLIYPYLQKYFVKGITLGAVKE